ncbi:trehalose-phosphatase [Desulfocurvus sp. DL9XJH121]
MRSWEDAASDEALWKALAGREMVLIMDFDGTLSPFVPEPGDARPYPGVREVLGRLREKGCRLVFVTGRDCRQLPDLLGLPFAPEVWGSHGGEHLLPDGTVEGLDLDSASEQTLARARKAVEDLGYEGFLESKPGCLSFHVRSMPEERHEAALDIVRRAWTSNVKPQPLELREFDGGLEARIPGMHKGRAVEAVLAEVGPETAVFYLGDDDTDEDAFETIRGRGLGILVRPKSRCTQASWYLEPPVELLAFLERLAALPEPAQEGASLPTP